MNLLDDLIVFVLLKFLCFQIRYLPYDILDRRVSKAFIEIDKTDATACLIMGNIINVFFNEFKRRGYSTYLFKVRGY